jgi:hypothetical protein
MPGPPPKPAGQRRRRNTVTAPVTLPSAGSRRKPPPLASVSAGTRAWWKTIWASPMAAAWLDSDVPGLARLARLLDLLNEGEPNALVLAEIRHLEDRFGLSPLARRRLQWEVEQPTVGEQQMSGKDDETRWLRAVSD